MQNSHRAAALALAFLLTATPVTPALSDPQTTAKSGDAQTTGEPPPPSSGASSTQSPAADDAQVKPADPFVPSESISADSAISFPVDI